jgi:hypothetical protein
LTCVGRRRWVVKRHLQRLRIVSVPLSLRRVVKGNGLSGDGFFTRKRIADHLDNELEFLGQDKVRLCWEARCTDGASQGSPRSRRILLTVLCSAIVTSVEDFEEQLQAMGALDIGATHRGRLLAVCKHGAAVPFHHARPRRGHHLHNGRQHKLPYSKKEE